MENNKVTEVKPRSHLQTVVGSARVQRRRIMANIARAYKNAILQRSSESESELSGLFPREFEPFLSTESLGYPVLK